MTQGSILSKLDHASLAPDANIDHESPKSPQIGTYIEVITQIKSHTAIETSLLPADPAITHPSLQNTDLSHFPAQSG
jgi:hypothetical protein